MPAAHPSHPKPRLFYGWWIVLACNAIACITWGVFIFNQGVFVAYYATAYDWSPAMLSAGPVLFHLWAGAVGVAIGRIVDRRGPKPILLTGAVLAAASSLAFASASEIWHVYPAFLLAGTGFACIHTVTIGKIVARWFVRRRARAMAAATFGAGLGGAALVPLNVAVIERFGAFEGGLTLAAISLAVIIPLALFVIRTSPEAMGLRPDGDAAPEADTPPEPATDDTRDWRLGEAMGTLAFWGLAVSFALGMLGQSAYLFHQMPYLQLSLGMAGAAGLVSVTTLCGILGRIVFIGLGDRLSPKAWVVAVYTVQALAFLILGLRDDVLGLTLGSACFGLTMGVMITLQPLVTAHIFGRESFGRIYGPIYMTIRFGSAFGPLAIGILLGATSSYEVGWFALAATLAGAALAIPFVIRRPAPLPLAAATT